jgi:glycine/D-amino acid oxidase-like deaminating enzyme
LANGAPVERIEPAQSGFTLYRAGQAYKADNVVLCAGLGNARLAPMVGLHAPVKPNRGQVLITERVRPFLKYPTGHVRQVGEGTVQLGDSKEDVGFDDSTRGDVAAAIARRATRTFPLLKTVRVVRSWGALRVMSPDGHPIYDKSLSCPGASLVTCHSGVTLAAAHAKVLAGWICGAEAPGYMEDFCAERFALQKAG